MIKEQRECDVYGSKRNVDHYTIKIEGAVFEDGVSPWHVEVDLCPRALDRVEQAIARAITPPKKREKKSPAPTPPLADDDGAPGRAGGQT